MNAPPRSPWLPKLVVAPSFILSFCFIYGLIAWNGYLSLSASRLLPNYEFAGFEQYVTLFESDRFRVALKNMNEDEIPSLMEWAHGKDMDLTLIEVMPMGDIGGENRVDQFYPIAVAQPFGETLDLKGQRPLQRWAGALRDAGRDRAAGGLHHPPHP